MHLTLHTDYSLRVLIYLGLSQEKLSSITEISDAYGISRNHIVKVVHRLGGLGYIETIRGRGGGLRLAREPGRICISEVVRRMEAMRLVECFDPKRNECVLTPACALKHALKEAGEAFLSTLDRYTLADLLKQPRRMTQLLSIGSA